MLETRADFLVGFPGETPCQTLDLARSLPLAASNFNLFTPFPGSDLAGEVEARGELRHKDYADYRPMTDPAGANPAYVPAWSSPRDIACEVSRLHRAFYLRPRYLLSRVASLRRPSDLARYWAGFRAIWRM